MKERPILMSGPMVRATLEDRKTKTRRVVVPTMTPPRVAPLRMEPWVVDGVQETDDNGLPCWLGFHPDYPGEAKWFSCPYGKAGDRLWVRETWQARSPRDLEWSVYKPIERESYRADDWRLSYRADTSNHGPADGRADTESARWNPSIFMPRWASRINLEIVSIDVERLQDISEEDAIAEGATATAAGDGYPWAMPARMNFVDLWDEINAARGYGWASNPYVWVIGFRRIV